MESVCCRHRRRRRWSTARRRAAAGVDMSLEQLWRLLMWIVDSREFVSDDEHNRLDAFEVSSSAPMYPHQVPFELAISPQSQLVWAISLSALSLVGVTRALCAQGSRKPARLGKLRRAPRHGVWPRVECCPGDARSAATNQRTRSEHIAILCRGTTGGFRPTRIAAAAGRF
jgi:hypothetical protein